VGRTEAREGADFFPLTVDVEERMYAAGKIPGGFFKREGRPTERAILTARMIDRPIRPLWPKGFKNEVQCIGTVLSADLITPHDILCINGVSAALTISPLPFFGPIGAVRVGLIEGNLKINPTLPEIEEESTLDLIVVGTTEGLTMVEAGAEEIPEETLLEALELAHAEIKKLCEAQEDLRRQVGKPKWLETSVTDSSRPSTATRSASGSSRRAFGPPRPSSRSCCPHSRWTPPRRTSRSRCSRSRASGSSSTRHAWARFSRPCVSSSRTTCGD
jgi:polyribonucleotide nucleotidyltransferase